MMVGLHRRMFNLPQLGAVFCPTAKKEKKEEEKKKTYTPPFKILIYGYFLPSLKTNPKQKRS